MINKIILLQIIFTAFVFSCENDKANSDSSNVELEKSSSVSGTVTYKGSYTGQNKKIYIRAYTANSKAIGLPDYATSLNEPGSYVLNLDGYSGDLYISAFMDVDNSGNSSGPNAAETLNSGVYSDPVGCYGDLSFASGGPVKININAELKNIDFELFDTGVLKVNLSQSGEGTLGVIQNSILSSEFLYHTHVHTQTEGNILYLALPPKNSWYVKLQLDTNPAELYSQSVVINKNNIREINF